MILDYAVGQTAATPEYVLAVIRDEHRQLCQFDPGACASIDLSFDSTVKEWRDACDLVNWRKLGQSLNREWGIEVSARDWRLLLDSSHSKRLIDVATFIAERAQRPFVRPALIAGCTCSAAGAFLTIRSILWREGAPVEGLKPSTPLSEYTLGYAHVFLGPISKLAPGAMPLIVETHHTIRLVPVALLCFGLLAIIINFAVGPTLALFGVGVVSLLAGYLIGGLLARKIPSNICFENSKTFADLARALAPDAVLEC